MKEGHREKLMLAGLFLALIAWGLQILDDWPVLVAHLTTTNWIVIALVHPPVLWFLIDLYAKTPKGTPARLHFLGATGLVIMSWSMNYSLMGKIGGH
jgi:hypothetical protein